MSIAPLPPTNMTRDPPAPLASQPKLPSNCCCCACCGAAPPKIDPQKILQDGGHYVQLSDGRIVEYFVYGDVESDRVLVQINGSQGTAKLFTELPSNQVLRDLHIKGLAVTVPGFGFSSPQYDRKIGNWPKDDLAPVLEVEGVTGNFMVEGTSYGTSHAMAVMHHFGDRVEKGHLHVPYLPLEMRKELGWKLYGEDDQCKCTPKWATSSPCSWYVSCGCSCCMSCFSCCSGCFVDKNQTEYEKQVPGLIKMSQDDIKRSYRGSGKKF